MSLDCLLIDSSVTLINIANTITVHISKESKRRTSCLFLTELLNIYKNAGISE
jgi:hypothetical protein